MCHKNLDHFGIKTEAWKNMAVVAQIKTEEGGSNALLALCHGESATVNAAALTFCSTFLSHNLPALLLYDMSLRYSICYTLYATSVNVFFV